MEPEHATPTEVEETPPTEDPVSLKPDSPKRRLVGFGIIYLLAWPLIVLILLALALL